VHQRLYLQQAFQLLGGQGTSGKANEAICNSQYPLSNDSFFKTLFKFFNQKRFFLWEEPNSVFFSMACLVAYFQKVNCSNLG
jgi:hypothetical protein